MLQVCGGRDHITDTHPTDSLHQCINCRKEHVANYINCNWRRCLMGLNPLPDTQESTKKLNKSPGKKNATKPSPVTTKKNATANQVLGLTPLKLHVSSALHNKVQEQVNCSSQRLHEKANIKHNTLSESQVTHMEGIEGEPSHSST